MARDVTGLERAEELVRQAEVRLKAGAPRLEALRLGEEGLSSSPSDKTEPLLARLAIVADDPKEVVDLYERQIARHRTMPERLAALARAAQVAAEHGQIDRARNLFELAIGAAPIDEVVPILERAARETDARESSDELRRVLCAAMANGGQGARDGGHTRAVLLRRAAGLVYSDVRDPDQAFAWLGDALVAHVDALTLDALEALAREMHDPRRAEATLSRALSEVFEGPLLRQLLARRAKLRREELDDRLGAATDLKKLYDLSPSDPTVLEDLSALLTQLGDHRAMVQLYEDQILRGKEVSSRAELARKVAQLWERELGDPREAADAWRRVLRMKPGDPEATAGLEGAKANMLRRSSESDQAVALPTVAEPTEPAESPTTAGSATTAESPTTPESAVIATTAVAAATIASTEAREGPETAAVGNDEPGERTQSPVPEPKRSIGRRRRRSGRPEPIEPTVAPVASEMPSPEATEAHPVADEPVADSTSTIPTPPATLVDPKGPAGETLFASSEAHIAVTKGPSIEATASRTVEVDVSAPDDGSEEEIEEVADVIESMDVPAPSEPASSQSAASLLHFLTAARGVRLRQPK
jgi:tetratricopeptide (TPR) repeat protein